MIGKEKATIEELEKILSGEDGVDIEILPSGEIVEKKMQGADTMSMLAEFKRGSGGGHY